MILLLLLLKTLFISAPVNCTRPNEVWDPYPSNCNFETCEDMNRECGDSSSGPPRCVCKPGYYRNQSDICIPATECSKYS